MADGMQRAKLWTERHSRALEDMVRQRWMTPPTHPLRILNRIAELGYARKCGQLFHPTPAADERVECMREWMVSPQSSLLDVLGRPDGVIKA